MMMRTLLSIACFISSLAPTATALAQGFTTAPARPVKGSLFRVFVPDARRGDQVTGEIAGEPLHFAWDTRDGAWALAAAPIDAPDSLTVEVSIVRGAGPQKDIIIRKVRLTPGSYPSERLSVNPRFGTKPDSATQARIDAEGARAAAVARAAHDTPRLWDGVFAAPRPGRVTSGFGRARVFNGQVASRHMGTDFAGAVGAPVRAVNRGVVRIVGQFFLGGNVVYIDHGAGLVTAYLHLSATDVAVDDTVAKGDVIGRVGATGRVTGPHLHLIARYGGVTVDPVSLLAVVKE
jgi:murein DD-endopeptidase MepM/ murein hydrolase activator NlpD